MGEKVCTVSNKPCRCDDGSGCSPKRAGMDDPARKNVRWLRTAALRLEDAKEALDQTRPDYEIRRAYPGPEVREVRRKLVTAISMLEEIINE